MKEQFRQYLIRQGYKQWTPSGNPSTVYDYIKRIEKVCEGEQLSWNSICNHIDRIILEYSDMGIKADRGAMSHNAVISSLRRFKEFIITIDFIGVDL